MPGYLFIVFVASLGLACGKGPRSEDVDRVVQAMKETPAEQLSPVWLTEALFTPAEARGVRPQEGASEGTGELLAFWERFRKAHPFGAQGIALSAPRKDGKRWIVIAEPPPHVRVDDIRAFVPDAVLLRQPIGHDGAHFDAGGSISGEAESLESRLWILHELLFQTSHEAYFYQEPFARPWHEARSFALDIEVSAGELGSWLDAESSNSNTVPAGPSVHGEAGGDSACSVFAVGHTGLIAWRIPSNTPPAACRPEIRRFAAESDLIVGAVKRNNGLEILGRERIAPFDVLPPLRTETVLLLAAMHDKDELEQSYERKHPGAGVHDSDFDWAPILLSPELIGTEYGQLLNVTDQLLKGWSQHGQPVYENFDYAKPSSWPFDEALSDLIARRWQSSVVTFNWNTTGLGYIFRTGDKEIYALNRTGALPVSYIPGEDPSLGRHMLPLEDRAWKWFASLQNPHLVRVVQYAALYQAFHAFGVTVSGVPPSEHEVSKKFEQAMQSYWDAVERVGPSDLMDLLPHTAVALRFSQFPHATLESLVLLRSGFEAWKQLEGSEKAAARRASLRQGGLRELPPSTRAALAEARYFLAAVAAKNDTAGEFSRSVAPSGRSWVHTPTVVFSNSGRVDRLAIGGHNLRAAATRLESTPDVPAGRVQASRGVLRLNPADSRHAPSIVREAARLRAARQDPAQMSRILTPFLQGLRPRPARNSREALQIPSRQGDPSRPVTGARGPLVARVTASAPPLPPPPQGTSYRSIRLRANGSTYTVYAPDGRSVLVTNLREASYVTSLLAANATPRSLFGTPSPLCLELEGFSESDRSDLLTNVRLNGRNRGYSEDIVAAIRESGVMDLRRLDTNTHDFANPVITVDPAARRGGETVAAVRVEFRARRQGIASVIVNFFIRARKALSSVQLLTIARAVETRVRQLFGSAAAPAAADPAVTFLLLQKELNHMGAVYGVDIEAEVRHAAGQWFLTNLRIRRDPHAS